MKTYRPDDWKNLYDCSVCDTEPEGCPGCGSNAFEAGYDRCLSDLEPLIRKIAPSSSLIDILYGEKK